MRTSTKPDWRKTRTQGLYEGWPAGIAETAVGTYYSRYSGNGKRTFRSLETSVYEHAKIKHAQRNVDVEKDRQRGADLGSDFRTLGVLWNEMKRMLDAIPMAEKTVVGLAVTFGDERLRQAHHAAVTVAFGELEQFA
jgi:hypothetical protein